MTVAAASFTAAGILGLVTVPDAQSSTTSQTVDLNGKAVREEGVVPTAETREAMKAVPDIGERFVVPSVGMDVRLGALDMADNTITPPGFTSAYLVRNLGVAPATADTGTVYAVMHSIRGGGMGPGNYLLDVETGAAAVSAGDVVEVAGRSYSITGSEAVPKQELPSSPIWQNTPGRLVIITCLQQPSGATSLNNLVIMADLLPTNATTR
jgi:hypothetical protein